jgi:hypothetical protein
MADAFPDFDFWTVLEEAEQTVAVWPEWQRRYVADVFYDGSANERQPCQ